MEQEESAYITSVHLKGYKSIRDVSVTLNKGLNIFIGANGSGKTNFLEFLDAAMQSDFKQLFNEQNLQFEVEILGKPYSKKQKGERIFQVYNNKIAYKVEQSVSNNQSSKEGVYYLNLDKKIENQETIKDDHIDFQANPFFSTLLLRFDNPLNSILKDKFSLGLNPSYSLSSGKEGVKTHPIIYIQFLQTIGNHSLFLNRILPNHAYLESKIVLKDFIEELTEKSNDFLLTLNQNLNNFSPIKDIKIDWTLTRKIIQEQYERETATIEGIDFQFYVNNEWINWTQLSDGTKRLFYLIGSVTYAKENEIILIEEPELGVHPHQLALLMNFLKSESEDKQIIISTHSPQVLNCLKGEELDRIIVARHEGKAGTKLYHLSEEEKGYASEYMEKEAFLSDYWMLSGFMNEEMPEGV